MRVDEYISVLKPTGRNAQCRLYGNTAIETECVDQKVAYSTVLYINNDLKNGQKFITLN